jgi:hypothetical protein
VLFKETVSVYCENDKVDTNTQHATSSAPVLLRLEVAFIEWLRPFKKQKLSRDRLEQAHGRSR